MVEECDKEVTLSYYTKTQHKIKVIVIKQQVIVIANKQHFPKDQ